MIDSDKPDYDFEEVSKLLHVAEKTRDYPKLKRIHDAAMAQLEFLDPEWRKKLSKEHLGRVVDRNSAEVRAWRKAVLKRDDYMCRNCNVKKNLHAHHVVGWSDAPWLRVEISNGMTLCNSGRRASAISGAKAPR